MGSEGQRMQLITAGKGFIGMNTARAFLDLGESCVLTTQHAERGLPDFLQKEAGKGIFIETLDLSDQKAFLEIGRRHKISGIVHLAGAIVGRGSFQDTIAEARDTVQGMLNTLLAAHEWGVPRVCVASTIGVYAGAGDSPFKEDALLALTPTHPLPMSKKILELLGGAVAFGSGLQIVNLRIGGAWGPLFHHPPSPWNIPGHMVKAAVRNEKFDASWAYGEEGGDSCYVKDLGRAIAGLQLASKLRFSTYNVGSGKAMKNKELVSAIRKAIPDADIRLSEGYDPRGVGAVSSMDTTRLREDTGFEPEYDVNRGIADYIEWLRKGNEN
jgi:UDP-glucose 4-epimerase